MPAVKLWLLVIIVVAVLSLLPDRTALGVPARGWSLGHIPAYAVLTVMTAEAFRRRFGRPGASVVGALVFAMLFGVAMEFIQPMVGRNFSVGDMARNGIGVLIGLACLPWLRRLAYRE